MHRGGSPAWRRRTQPTGYCAGTRGRQLRPKGWLGLGLVIGSVGVAGLAGCGSSGSSNADCEKFHAGPAYLACINGEPIPTDEADRNGSAESTTTYEPPEEVGGSLDYVGSITGSGHGTAFVDRYSVGPLLYGADEAPPEDLLNACAYTRPSRLTAPCSYADS